MVGGEVGILKVKGASSKTTDLSSWPFPALLTDPWAS
jgi:hypothetical protein